jgi:5-methyltetrahydrofolate--homocysteine methyltransferase
MIIIGERLNSSRKSIFEAFKKRDANFILNEAKKQEQAGAHYLDINAAALLEEEIEILSWAIPLIQNKIKIPLCIDTPNLKAMEKALEIHKGKAILNSITGEKEKIKNYIPLIKKFKPRIVALCLNENGLPSSPDKELEIAKRIINELKTNGVSEEDIFIDPLVRPIGTDSNAGLLFLQSLEKIKKEFPKIKTIAGISNISFGLPNRKLLNKIFFIIAYYIGLDAAIIDPLDTELIDSLFSIQAILGKDKYCSDYLKHIRSKKFSS